MKICTVCRKLKSFRDFYSHKRGSCLRSTQCKECARNKKARARKVKQFAASSLVARSEG